MAIFAISDLHLSFGENKPMDIFGMNWENHTEKIKEDWNNKVKDEDLVLLPGDFSWAMYLENTYKDFEYLSQLKGKKLLLKGNHDYWWNSLKKMREYLKNNNFENIDFIYNNSYFFENRIIVGTRGWANEDGKENEKIINRENMRLEASLRDGINKYGNNKEIIVCTHFPPFNECICMIETMKKYNVRKCIYGHIHGNGIKEAFQGDYEGINFELVSSDGIDFRLKKI